MHCIVLSTNFRNYHNWGPMFQQLQNLGHSVESMLLPWRGDPSVVLMEQPPFLTRCNHPIESLDRQGLPEAELSRLLDDVVTPEVGLVFLTDIQSYPSNTVHTLLSQRDHPPRVIGLQHGLFQSWWLYNQQFGADELLCFGTRHVRELVPALRARAHPVGLPKLDALQHVGTDDGRYILYLAQRVPESEGVMTLLVNLQQATGLPVAARSHPQYPLSVHRTTASIDEPRLGERLVADLTYVEQLANASWVLTPHSTGGIEALHLGKPVVLLPNHGLTAWAGYPGVATDMSVGAVLAGLERAKHCRSEVEMFLADTFGGLRFDSAERSVATVLRLSAQPRVSRIRAAALPPAHCAPPGNGGLESMSWLFQCDNRNRGIVRQNFDEAALLWRTVRATGGPILEVGRRHGGTTVLLLEAAGERPVTSIDIAPDHHPAADAVFKQVTDSQPGRLLLLTTDSRKPLADEQCFGMIFIDGDHSYEGVRADTVAHWDTLQSHDGREPLVVYHDAVPNAGLKHEGRINHCEGVESLVHELVEAGCADVVAAAGSSLVLRKKAELPSAWLFEVRRGYLTRRDDVISLVRKGGVGIELGVAEGVLSERFLKRNVLSHLYSIDMYAGDRGHDNEQYKRTLRRLAHYRNRNTLIKLRFDEALVLFEDATFDFIYIDGYAHTGEESGQTLLDWYSKLKPGGILAGDDYCAEWPLVVAEVDRFTAAKGLPLHVIDCREDAAYCRHPTWFTRKPD
jgi:predicted O-methyltransferase YrrM